MKKEMLKGNINWLCINDQCNNYNKLCDGAFCHSCQNIIKVNSDNIWDIMPEFSPSGFPISRCEHLSELEKTHFWFKPRAKLLKKLLNTMSSQKELKILELGSGSGHFTNSINSNHDIYGIEGHMEFLNIARREGTNVNYFHCDISNIPFADNQFDIILAFDVLEHTDSKKLLDEAYRLTKPKGQILISVPAFPCLWSKVDEQAGHRLRYTINQMKKELVESGWNMYRKTYYQMLLFPVVFISRKLHSKKPPKVEHKPPKWMNKVFYWVNNLEVLLFSKLNLPFGSSLITIANKLKK
jgi:ubiquinone/menaquinone biosynthesis C-methylase UbiE